MNNYFFSIRKYENNPEIFAGFKIGISDQQSLLDTMFTSRGVEVSPQFLNDSDKVEALRVGVIDAFYTSSEATFTAASIAFADDSRFSVQQFNSAGGLISDGDNSTLAEVFRFFNTETGSHFYTSSISERDQLSNELPQFVYEGNSFGSNATAESGGLAVHRFFNTETGTHFYTASEEERQNIANTLTNMSYEGVSYYAYSGDNGTNEALYRFFNTENGTHFFTTSETERDNIINTLGHYNYEGIAYYVDVA